MPAGSRGGEVEREVEEEEEEVVCLKSLKRS